MSTQGSLDRSLSPPSIPPSLVEEDEVTPENGPCAAIVVGTLLGGVCVASKKNPPFTFEKKFKKCRVNSTNKKPSPMDSSAGAEGISFPAFRGILGDSRVLTDFLPPLNFFRRFTFTFSKKR